MRQEQNTEEPKPRQAMKSITKAHQHELTQTSYTTKSALQDLIRPSAAHEPATECEAERTMFVKTLPDQKEIKPKM